MKGIQHYKKNGSLHCGKSHKHDNGTVMTGKAMSKDAVELFHYKDLPKPIQSKINPKAKCKKSLN